jgi:iron complex outermembrane receptor protein
MLMVLPASAQLATAPETIQVTADPVHLMSGTGEAATGLALPLAATPRAASQVSETTLNRYGVEGLDDLTSIAPSSYTGSFYGVEGEVNLRGAPADNYFRGFRRAENRGTYATQLAGDVTILRGPPSPVFGAGKLGGLVDLEPAPVRENSVTLSYGAYEKRNLAAQAGLPVGFAGVEGRLGLKADFEDSFSFYRGLHPRHQAFSLDLALASGAFSFAADYLFRHADGEVQTPGWNRLTQQLIDQGVYVTGRNTSLKDTDGNGRLTLEEFGGNPYAFDPAFRPLAITGGSDAAHRLDSGFGTALLDRRTVYLAPGVDFSRTGTNTFYAEARRDLGGDALRLQLFGDTLGNDRFVSYGYPATLRTQIGEARLRYDFDRAAGAVSVQGAIGASFRLVHAVDRQSFNSGVIALDRRDLTQGPAANDTIDSPFNSDPAGSIGLGWENSVSSNIADAGLFAQSEFSWQGLNLLLGGRYDDYTVRSRDDGVLAYEPPSGRAGGGRVTGSASLSWQLGDWMPYLTHAVSSALEAGQAGEVPTQLLVTGGWLSASRLDELGLKYAASPSNFGELEASLALYRQSRSQLSQLGGVHVSGARGEGIELELRWLTGRHLSATLAASLSHNFIRGDHGVAYIPARNAGISPQDGFGGAYLTYDFGGFRGSPDYDDTLLPHLVISPYLTWSSGEAAQGWGASLGATYSGAARQTVPDPLVFPAHVTVNASGLFRRGGWRVALNLYNVFDARFFTPDADTYANLGALPGMGRRWRIALTRRF